MKVYFTASVTGKQLYDENYRKIVECLRDYGYELMENDILESDVRQKMYGWAEKELRENYERIMGLARKSDIVVAEVSYPSASVGLEVSNALGMGKPVVLLHVSGKRAVLVEGIKSERLQIIEYDMDNLKKLLKQTMVEAEKMLDVRFNFFISPKLLDFLNWIAKEKGTTKSAFVRELIKREMERIKEHGDG
ncbi:hypothetical protein A3K55_02430 [Candidatus Shapirobacteria bacterium RBG_13_44_7]|uniref:Ribbon-helix-helix protein CopG domain-containing protein n=1 Tax=Candidatus Shapirobacteria bacterium RBG_13_44_7 TaxID=1802149 RepID=A0A1F7SM39_9BACT|nr:MAG: hypothetical protein A3K55_02430 [Candidatus Shapirobacteria bacterium RBG_13_44_7]